MFAEQAIYTSARTQKTRGYHLISRSPGVDEQQVRNLTQWCPSHAGLACSDPNASSLNFHPTTDGWYALSRTVYGGPEYSGRGGLQVVTRILLFQADELAPFDYDPLTAARFALALGHLRLEPNAPENLPALNLPNPHFPAPQPPHPDTPHDAVEELIQCLSEGKRIAVVGLTNPIKSLGRLFARFPGRQRLEMSFATGLKHSLYRPFRIQFLPTVTLPLQQQLVGQGIAVLTAASPSPATVL